MKFILAIALVLGIDAFARADHCDIVATPVVAVPVQPAFVGVRLITPRVFIQPAVVANVIAPAPRVNINVNNGRLFRRAAVRVDVR